MSKFIFFFRGAQPTIKDQEAQNSQWLAWVDGLKQKGNFIEGSPLVDDGKIIVDDEQNTRRFNFNFSENASGFIIVKAESLDEAVALSKSCPIFVSGGNITVRPIKTSY